MELGRQQVVGHETFGLSDVTATLKEFVNATRRNRGRRRRLGCGHGLWKTVDCGQLD